MGKRVLVTGGAGYIGCVLVRQLLDRGYQVRILDRLYWGKQPLNGLAERVEVVCDDVRTFSLDALVDVDAVVHLAGLSNDPTAEYDPAANWQMNAVATQRLADACAEMGISRFTYGSSCSVYDGLPTGVVYDECSPVKPRGAYATSKFFGEECLLEAASKHSGFCPVILRQGTVYGWSPRMRFDLVVNTFVKDALIRGKLLLHGGGWMWRPLVDVSDVARAHIACLEADEDAVRGEIMNVVHDNYQIRQLAMLVAGSVQLLKRQVDLEVIPAPPAVRNYKCSNLKMRQVLGFVPEVTPLESIETILKELELGDIVDLAHPRHYNIAWMTMLNDVREQFAQFAAVF